MHNRRNAKQLPVAARQHTFSEHRVACVCVPEKAERADGPEELVADCPAEGPLSAQQLGAGGVVWGTWGWEVDEEGGDGHVGLGDCVSW